MGACVSKTKLTKNIRKNKEQIYVNKEDLDVFVRKLETVENKFNHLEYQFTLMDTRVMFLEGKGTSTNSAQAYAWFKVASINGQKEADEACRIVEKSLSHEQVENSKEFIDQIMGAVPNMKNKIN